MADDFNYYAYNTDLFNLNSNGSDGEFSAVEESSEEYEELSKELNVREEK
jgi:hypothetical protein